MPTHGHQRLALSCYGVTFSAAFLLRHDATEGINGVIGYKGKFFHEATRVAFAMGMLEIDVFNIYHFLVANLKIRPNL